TGDYTLTGLAPGTYRVGFSDDSGHYFGEFWNDKATLEAADGIAVSESATVAGRNAVLASASHLRGRVTNSVGTGLAGIHVSAYTYSDQEGWYEFRSATTDASGNYD
ncbi:hypothetical protein, partial [Streptobacillus moniliformis]|uniref:hypothetical protein n=1 Tax=Streptobacillus moniliformis TaxID=34105 RepID=UPI0018C86094